MDYKYFIIKTKKELCISFTYEKHIIFLLDESIYLFRFLLFGRIFLSGFTENI